MWKQTISCLVSVRSTNIRLVVSLIKMNCWSLLVTFLVIAAIAGSYIWIGVVQAGNAPLSKLNVTGDGVIEGNLTVNGTINGAGVLNTSNSSVLPEGVVTVDSTWFGAAQGSLTVLESNGQVIASEMEVTSTKIDVAGRRLVDLHDPCLPQDAATKNWVMKHTIQNNPASFSTQTLANAKVDTSNLLESHPLRTYLGSNLFLQLVEGLIVDNVELKAGDRLLILNHSSPQVNGVYVIGQTAGSRAQDMSQGKINTFDVRVPVEDPDTVSYLLVTPTDAKDEPNIDQQATGNATDSCGNPYDALNFVRECCFLKMHDWNDGKDAKDDVVGKIPLVDCVDPCKAKANDALKASISPEGLVKLMVSNPFHLLFGGENGGGLRFRSLDDKVYVDLLVDGGESTMSLEFSENNVQFIATP